MRLKNIYKDINKTLRFLVFTGLVSLVASCAQVPQSSVKLSSSIADDVMSMQKAHKEFINYYYDGLEQQANDLIDNKYRPSLIRQVIEQDAAKFKDPDKRDQSLFNAIREAFIENKNLNQSELAIAQSDAMACMKIFYTKIDKKVESERKKLLDPLRQQRQELLGSVDANYTNIIRKNAAITALLNSVTEVHETQQQLLSMAGVEENLREKVGSELANLADKLEEIQDKVDDRTARVEDVENAINEFKKLISKD
jgi:hypothetical protein